MSSENSNPNDPIVHVWRIAYTFRSGHGAITSTKQCLGDEPPAFTAEDMDRVMSGVDEPEAFVTGASYLGKMAFSKAFSSAPKRKASADLNPHGYKLLATLICVALVLIAGAAFYSHTINKIHDAFSSQVALSAEYAALAPSALEKRVDDLVFSAQIVGGDKAKLLSDAKGVLAEIESARNNIQGKMQPSTKLRIQKDLDGMRHKVELIRSALEPVVLHSNSIQ